MNKYTFVLLSFCVCLSVQAKVILPAYFSDNMIVQQKNTLIVPGKSTNGKEVVVKAGWSSKDFRVMPDPGGNFEVRIPTPKAGGPYMLTVDDGELLTLRNILVGEVWLCSGQSNMEMPVSGWGKVMNYEKEISEAVYPSIRLLQVKKVISHTPSEKLEINGDGWKECSPTSVENFSAVAYFYARNLWEKLKVPVGVIDCTWGGTPAEAWTGLSALKHVWGFEEDAVRIGRCRADRDLLMAKYQEDMSEWEKQFNACDPGMKDGIPCWISSEQSGEEWKKMKLPGAWEHNGLPDFDGSVWFQKIVEIPSGWEGKPLTLNLGMIDDKDITYFNGKEIARGEGYYIKRTYTVPAELVTPGKGIITVKVQDQSGTGGICGSPEDLSINMGNDKISLAGEWNYRIGVPLSQQPPVPFSPDSQNYPSVLYNAMVYPLRQFPIKGAIWYQGEANVERAVQYTPLFQAMIADWRQLWKNDFPFYFVQLANFLNMQEVQPNSTWAHLREAQANALHLEKTGMAVTIDIGEAYDIHPKNKQEVGRRLAQLALSDTYGKGKYQVPAYQNYKIEKGSAVLSFNQEIMVKGDQPTGFVIAGPDMRFYPARAEVKGNIVIVTSPNVSVPVAVRYGWADNPPCNLYGNNGLPLAPFRTDAFE